MRKCDTCGQPINPERLEALPDTRHCTAHSTTKAKLVRMFQDHKTGAYAVVIDTNGPGATENIRQAERAYRRGR